MEKNIKQFLAYCKRTGERPELAYIDNKTYLVEWHPNKALERVSLKLALYEDLEYLFLHKKPQPFIVPLKNFSTPQKVKHQGTTSCDVRRMLCDHKRYLKLWKRQ